MKKSKLTLKKFQIAKLTNPSKIYGGTGVSALCDTDTNPLTTDTETTATDDTSNDNTDTVFDTTSTATNGTLSGENNTTRSEISTVPTCPL